MPPPRVRVISALGGGGMGLVWLAEREVGDGVAQRVVVKRPRPDDPQAARRFADEVRALALVSHGNVVRLLDAGADPEPFAVVEYVDGVDAAALVEHARAPGAAMGAEEVAWIVREAARGLAAAHAARRADGAPAGILHRDVSPQNLLVSREGEVKVTDFGIAWAAERANETVTGTVVGNPRYMAPEQFDGRVAGPATDVYGLGCVLEALLGRGARDAEGAGDGRDDGGAARGEGQGEGAAGGARAALAGIAERATRRAPEERFATMDAVVDALEGAVPTLALGRAAVARRVAEVARAREGIGGALRGLLGGGDDDDDDAALERPPTRALATAPRADGAAGSGGAERVARGAAPANTAQLEGAPEAERSAPPARRGGRASAAAAAIALLAVGVVAGRALVGRANEATVAAPSPARARATASAAQEDRASQDDARALAPSRERAERTVVVARVATSRGDAGGDDGAAVAAAPEPQAPQRAPVPAAALARAQPRRGAPAQPAGDADAGVATLRVSALPRAAVTIDGRPAGQTPVTTAVSAGDHVIRAEFEGGGHQTRAVRLAPGQTLTVPFERVHGGP